MTSPATPLLPWQRKSAMIEEVKQDSDLNLDRPSPADD
jgi:hypothetical protein